MEDISLVSATKDVTVLRMPQDNITRLVNRLKSFLDENASSLEGRLVVVDVTGTDRIVRATDFSVLRANLADYGLSIAAVEVRNEAQAKGARTAGLTAIGHGGAVASHALRPLVSRAQVTETDHATAGAPVHASLVEVAVVPVSSAPALDMRPTAPAILAHPAMPAPASSAPAPSNSSPVQMPDGALLETAETAPRVETGVVPAGTEEAGSVEIVTQRIRTGMEVVGRCTNVTVVGDVAQASDVVARGSITVTGCLKGRAIAGRDGDIRATIVAMRFCPDLVSIAGVYLSRNDIPMQYMHKSVIVRLVDGNLQLETF